MWHLYVICLQRRKWFGDVTQTFFFALLHTRSLTVSVPSREEVEPAGLLLLAERSKKGFLLVNSSCFFCLHHHCRSAFLFTCVCIFKAVYVWSQVAEGERCVGTARCFLYRGGFNVNVTRRCRWAKFTKNRHSKGFCLISVTFNWILVGFFL